ncbi:malonic semialdehyde reductase [Pseudonocardia sp. NPDC049635]|uniref:malonic semialdehyde reductase n=1 Tax=Pseudonocardia sp. NPDC049635 TaxID=3155506 RepID=UPI0033D0D4A0
MTTETQLPLRLPVLDDAGRAVLFTEARTSNTFSDEPVSDETLRSIWDLAQWPPTAANTQPLRVTFVRTAEAKKRLIPLLAEGNRAKSEQAPVTAILAADLDFHEHTPFTFPINPDMRDNFEAQGRDGREGMARFNAGLQIGYLLLAVRAHGLASGPMAGFDADAVTEEFFPGGRLRALLVVNIGHPGADPWYPRLPRLAAEDVLSFI